MRYASLMEANGSALSLMQSAGLFGVGERSALRTGSALELIHCYHWCMTTFPRWMTTICAGVNQPPSNLTKPPRYWRATHC